MKLTNGIGNPREGGCWMVVASMYSENRWTDHPKCVDPLIRCMCILLNDSISSDERREELIGPHLWAPIGTRQRNLEAKRRNYLVRAVQNSLIQLLQSSGIDTKKLAALKRTRNIYKELDEMDWPKNQLRIVIAHRSKVCMLAALSYDDWHLALSVKRYLEETHPRRMAEESYLQLILALCAMSTPEELVPERQAKVLEVMGV